MSSDPSLSFFRSNISSFFQNERKKDLFSFSLQSHTNFAQTRHPLYLSSLFLGEKTKTNKAWQERVGRSMLSSFKSRVGSIFISSNSDSSVEYSDLNSPRSRIVKQKKQIFIQRPASTPPFPFSTGTNITPPNRLNLDKGFFKKEGRGSTLSRTSSNLSRSISKEKITKLETGFLDRAFENAAYVDENELDLPQEGEEEQKRDFWYWNSKCKTSWDLFINNYIYLLLSILSWLYEKKKKTKKRKIVLILILWLILSSLITNYHF